MPNCENCGRKWEWKTIALKTFKLTNKVNCPFCGKAQYFVPKSRKVTGIFTFLPAFLILASGQIFDLNVLGIVLLAATLLIVTLAFYPFLMKLCNDNETGLFGR